MLTARPNMPEQYHDETYRPAASSPRTHPLPMSPELSMSGTALVPIQTVPHRTVNEIFRDSPALERYAQLEDIEDRPGATDRITPGSTNTRYAGSSLGFSESGGHTPLSMSSTLRARDRGPNEPQVGHSYSGDEVHRLLIQEQYHPEHLEESDASVEFSRDAQQQTPGSKSGGSCQSQIDEAERPHTSGVDASLMSGCAGPDGSRLWRITPSILQTYVKMRGPQETAPGPLFEWMHRRCNGFCPTDWNDDSGPPGL